MPAAMTSETAFPAASVESNAASRVRTDPGRRSSRRVTFVTTASVPSAPHQHPEQVEAGAVEGRTAEMDHLPVGQDRLDPDDVMHREAVLQAVRAPGVLRPRCRRSEQMTWLDGSGA